MIHHLGPELPNLHGWFDKSLPTILSIASGDTIVYNTPDAGWNDLPPGYSPDNPLGRRHEGTGHALIGPVWVEGAEPGDTLAVHISEIVVRDWGWGIHRPGKSGISGILGGEPDDIDSVYFQHFFLERERNVWRFNERIEIPAAPFMGIFAVAPPDDGRTETFRPGPYGGNMDCKELTASATIFLPVFVPGALFSVGDGHGAQGDGEIDGAAIETGMDRLVLEFSVHKDLSISRPCAETATHLLFLAFDEDLDVAVLEASRDVVHYLQEHEGLTRDEAYNLASLAVDFRITQVVDGLRGVHAMLPKAIFTTNAPTLA